MKEPEIPDVAQECGTAPILSASIMAHPRRAENARRILAHLSPLRARIVFDPEPFGSPSTSRTARLAWRPWLRSATHHLVLQDDVVLHPRFVQQIQEAVASQPRAALSFFSEWGSFTSNALRVAALAGASWVSQPDTYLSTVAMVLPTRDAELASEFISQHPGDPDDECMGRFVQSRRMDHFVSNPNLVDHDVLSSLVGNGNHGVRRATNFVADTAAPATWWSTPPLDTPDRVPSLHWRTGTPSSYERSSEDAAVWTIAAQRDHWRESQPAISRIVRRSLEPLGFETRDIRFYNALLGAALVLCDQIALAATLDRRDGDFASLCARSAVHSLAPGTLRGVARNLGLDADSQEIERTFIDIYERVDALVRGSSAS